MSKQLRKQVSEELQRRHGYKVMEVKIKPVHIANALMRTEHQCAGRMPVLEQLFEATLSRNSIEKRVAAVTSMLETQRERWGALGQAQDLKSSPLMTKVLPLIRILLGADGAAFGTSPQLSSFSSPTALTVTGDPSDDGAATFVHALWGGRDGPQRLKILDLLAELTSPSKTAESMDDLSALLVPLVDATRPRPATPFAAEDLKRGLSEVEIELRDAANALHAYEAKLRPNPISSLQRIVLLAALSVFRHGSTREQERAGGLPRVLLLDASGDAYSEVARASTSCVSRLIADACKYMTSAINDLLEEQLKDWPKNPLGAVNALLEAGHQAPLDGRSVLARRIKEIQSDFDDPEDVRKEVTEELLSQIEGNQRQGLDGYLRLLGMRSGFLYPTTKNPNKRLNPADRTLEVLVASTVDVHQAPVEYRDFLHMLRSRWAIVVGGRTEDSAELEERMGVRVPVRALRDNSDRFLDRLESLGLARRLADSVAVVGLLETLHE